MPDVVLVTGAKGGLGAHITRAFLATGATVAGSSRRIADADFAHANFFAVPADLVDAALLDELERKIRRKRKELDRRRRA